MPYKEKEIQKLYYSIGEVAAMFGVNTSLIRFWEKEFDIIKPSKTKKGNRMFSAEDVENFKKIFILVKGEGYTLQGAKEKLKNSIISDKKEEKEEASKPVISDSKEIKTENLKEVIIRLRIIKDELLNLSEKLH
jgi:DNA-binding transcriptional MerR regulator